MSLPEPEIAILRDDGLDFSIVPDGNMTCVVIQKFSLPGGYKQKEADMLLRLPPGFPDAPPDMWWFDPPLQRIDGQAIPATDAIETHLSRRWQRWSRHFQPGQWTPGVDCMESFLALIRKELRKGVGETV